MTHKNRTPFALLIILMIAAMLGSVLAQQDPIDTRPGPSSIGKPTELIMQKGASTTLDLRKLPQTPPQKRERPEREEPESNPTEIKGGTPPLALPFVPLANAPAPAPVANFLGLDFANWGAGRPPDTVGDVGPTYYIQAVNTSIGIFRKSDGGRVAAFTFDTFMSQGNFPDCTICSTANFGDPVILYDSFEDRWVITDFAFQLDGSNNVVNPPGAFQVFAVSKTGDPVMGGWNFYSLHLTDALNDYPKFGIWPDGLYMSANMFGFPASGSFQGTRVWAFNKAQMYAGEPTAQVVQFSPPAAEFTLLPSNARLQAGTPPLGTPNYFSTVFNFTNAVSTYKFHVDWNSLSLSTFTGPFLTIAPASWISPPATVPAQGGNNNDTLAVRLMMQNQYSNIGGVESLWNSHTIRNPTTAGVSAVRYYQVTVNGGTVAANTTQAFTHAPDTTNRYMPSLAVDRQGDMMMGYSASTSALFPAIRYAGRLATDPVNTLPQTETSLIEGTGSQNTSTRWGDYSAMSLDPDGCTFWFTSEYYITTGSNWQTRIGSVKFAECTPVGNGGTLSGTVTATVGGAPISGATVALGSRTTITDMTGFYSFASLPAGTYPTITASAPGYSSSTANMIVVTDGNTTTQNFSLAAAPASACLTDTTQANFQTGVPTIVDLTSSPGDIILLDAANVDQQNTSVTSSGFGFTSTSWFGQTFQPAVTGQMTRADIDLFCSGCTGTTPNITVSIRATSADLPTGADLATATIPGFSSGAGGYFTASFATPPTLTSGTRYAIVVRAVSNPSAGTYAYVVSTGSPYANGRRVTSTNSGSTWTGQTTDVGFITYMKTGFAAAGDFTSSVKDSNPASGFMPVWTSLSWTATVPANTTLRLQAAASNSTFGPFNFVGPDGTSATYFTSGGSLSQFNGNRYLKYKAFFTTSNNTMTPTLNDVTVCFSNLDCTSTSATITLTPAQVCPNSTGNMASGPAGASSYAWSIANGSITGGQTSQTVTYTAGASGNVGLMLSLTAPNGCQASNSTNVPIVTVAAPTITPGGPTTFCPGGSVTLNSSSASGNQWYLGGNPIGGATGQQYIATASGSYTVVVTTSGCPSAPSAPITVTASDTTPPTLTCPSNVTVSNDAGLCTAVVSYTAPTATDNCPPTSFAATCVPPTGSTFAKGVTTVNCSATDASSNPATPCSFTVTVNDTEKPQSCLTPPANMVSWWPGDGNARDIQGVSPNNNDGTLTGGATATATGKVGQAFSFNGAGQRVSVTNSSSINLTGTAVTIDGWINPNSNAADAVYFGKSGSGSNDYLLLYQFSNISAIIKAGGTETILNTSVSPAIGQWTHIALVYNGTDMRVYVNGALTGGATAKTGNLAGSNVAFGIGGRASGLFFNGLVDEVELFNRALTATEVLGIYNAGSFGKCKPVAVNTAAGLCTATNTYTNPAFTDNCTGASINCTPAANTTFAKGTTTVSCTVTDASSNTYMNAFEVRVVDNEAPALGPCPANQTVNESAPGSGSATVTYTSPTATDNCPGQTVSCVPASGTMFPVGTTTVSCKATDTSGNMSAPCTFTVTVNPLCTVNCPANVVQNADANLCTAVVTYTAPTTTGSCGTVTCSPASGTVFNKGVTTVTCTPTVAAPPCTFTVTVVDNQAPMIGACPANQTVNTAAGQCQAVVTYTNPTATDNCPGATVSCSPSSGSNFPKGVTTVTCTATDTATVPNMASCTFTVTVVDNQPPTFPSGCPANQTVNTAASQCQAVVTYTNPTATDNCPGATVSCSPASGTSFAKGVTTVTCTATDTATPTANTATCTFTITVVDNQDPILTPCPANQTVNTAASQCQATVTYTAPTATDNCPGVGSVSCTPASGSSFPKGVTTVTCSVSDAAKRTTSCSFTVTVVDNQPPTFPSGCPANQTVSTGGTCATVSYTNPAVADNCPGATVSCTPASGTCFPVGTTTVTCTATDAAAIPNMAQCQFTITVIPCIITCPANITRANDANQCGAVVTFAPSATMGCGVVTCSPASGSLFPKGVTTVTCNTQAGPSCSFTVTVNDTQPPSLVCPPNQTRVTPLPGGTTAAVTYPAPTVSDNCPGATVVCTPPSGSTFALGVSTVSCTATDAVGNTASCSFTVTVFDVCLQDDSSAGNVLLWNTQTGDYRFCCNGSVFTGKGTVVKQGNTWTLTHNAADRRVSATLDGSLNRGNGNLQSPPGTTRCAITDRNTTNNSCSCQ